MNVFDEVLNKAWVVKTLAGAGIIRPTRPDKLARIALTLHRWGPTPAAGYTASAIRFPNETAIIDELGTLTFREQHERSNALAHALAEEAVAALRVPLAPLPSLLFIVDEFSDLGPTIEDAVVTGNSFARAVPAVQLVEPGTAEVHHNRFGRSGWS